MQALTDSYEMVAVLDCELPTLALVEEKLSTVQAVASFERVPQCQRLFLFRCSSGFYGSNY